VAGILRVSTMTVYRLIRSGELTAARVGRGYRIWNSDVDAYLARDKR
jgi:excisionase family DNA binding protein